jgi:hypothetical protein
LRGDKASLPQFIGEKALRNNWTIAEWKAKKFLQQYSGYDVEILDGN